MSRTETFRRSVKQANEAENKNIFEAADELRAAIRDLANQNQQAEELANQITTMTAQVPEQIAIAVQPLSEALEAQITSSKSATNKLGNLAKKSVGREAQIARELENQTLAMKDIQGKVSTAIQKLADDRESLTRELYATREALQKAQKTPILAHVLVAAVPTSAVLWMAWAVGLIPVL